MIALILPLLLSQLSGPVHAQGTADPRPLNEIEARQWVDRELVRISADPEFQSLQSLAQNLPLTRVQTGRETLALHQAPAEVAQALFRIAQRYSLGDDGFDGYCYGRNFFWHQILAGLGIRAATGLIYVTDQSADLIPLDERAQAKRIRWRYHIAPAICVAASSGNGCEFYILDPALFAAPVTLEDWVSAVAGHGNSRRIRSEIVPAGVLTDRSTNPDSHRFLFFRGKSPAHDLRWSKGDWKSMGRVLPKKPVKAIH